MGSHSLNPVSPQARSIVYEGFPKLGIPFGWSHNEDYSISGSILGSPYFGKIPYMDLSQKVLGQAFTHARHVERTSRSVFRVVAFGPCFIPWLYMGNIGFMGLLWDNGKEHGSNTIYYNGVV